MGAGKPAVTSQVKNTSWPGSTTTVSFTDSRIIGGAEEGGDTGEEERRKDYKESKSLSLWLHGTERGCFPSALQLLYKIGGLVTLTLTDVVNDVNCLSAPVIQTQMKVSWWDCRMVTGFCKWK